MILRTKQFSLGASFVVGTAAILLFQNCSDGFTSSSDKLSSSSVSSSEFQAMPAPTSTAPEQDLGYPPESYQAYSAMVLPMSAASLKAFSKGGRVLLPCGPLQISSVELNRDIEILGGCRAGRSIVKVPQVNLANYNVFRSYAPISIRLSGIVFDGSWTGGKGGPGEPILEFHEVKNVTLENSEFKNLSMNQTTLPIEIDLRRNMMISIKDAKQVSIHGNSVHDIYRYEIFQIASTDKRTIASVTNNRFYNLKAANSPINAFNLSRILIADNTVTGIKSSAFNVFSDNATISRNKLSDLQTAGIDMYEGMYLSRNAVISDNIIVNCGLREAGSGAGIVVSGSKSQVLRNKVMNCDAGIVVYNSVKSDSKKYGNLFHDKPMKLDGILIEGNQIAQNRVVNLRIQSSPGAPISATIRGNTLGNRLQTTLWNLDLREFGSVIVDSNLLYGSGQSSLSVRGSFQSLQVSNNTFKADTGSLGNYVSVVGSSSQPSSGSAIAIIDNFFRANLSPSSYDFYSNGYFRVKSFTFSNNPGADKISPHFKALVR